MVRIYVPVVIFVMYSSVVIKPAGIKIFFLATNLPIISYSMISPRRGAGENTLTTSMPEPFT